MRRLAVMAIALAILAAGCATTSEPTEPKVLDVRGVWIGDWEFEPATAGRGIFTLTLNQMGTDVSGAVQLTGLDRTMPTAVSGVLKGNEIHLVGMAANGVLIVVGDNMTGKLNNGQQISRIVAKRQSD